MTCTAADPFLPTGPERALASLRTALPRRPMKDALIAAWLVLAASAVVYADEHLQDCRCCHGVNLQRQWTTGREYRNAVDAFPSFRIVRDSRLQMMPFCDAMVTAWARFRAFRRLQIARIFIFMAISVWSSSIAISLFVLP